MGRSKIEKQNVEDMMGLTAMQEGMLFHYLAEPGSLRYFEQFRFQLKGKINTRWFEGAWAAVAQVNETLRAVIRWEQLEEPVQIVLKDKKIPICIMDLSAEKPETLPSALAKIAAKDKNQTIDLTSNPLRITLILTGTNENEMLITFHHILYDGWSNGIILREFLEAYNCLAGGKKPEIEPKTKYKEFIKWFQNDRIQNKDKHETFWKNYLAGFDTYTTLPYDGVKTGDILHVQTIREAISPVLRKQINEFSQAHNVTPAAILYAAWGILLQKYNNADDIIFGTTVSGRVPEIKGSEDVVGLFINTIPLRLKTTGAHTVLEVLAEAGAHLQERSAHEHSPLTDIKRWAGAGIGQESQLFDAIFVIDNYPLPETVPSSGECLTIASYELFEMTDFDLTVQVMLPDMFFDFHFNADVFETGTMQRLAGHYMNILEGMIAAPDEKVSGIQFLSGVEVEQILGEFNDPGIMFVLAKTIHGVIEKQAERVPGNRAVQFKDRWLTYRELNENANRLAHLLCERGVTVGSRVALLMPRSVEMMVCLLGIFKAGAACIPLDISYPVERNGFILDDSESGYLLKHRSAASIAAPGVKEILYDKEDLKNYKIDNLNTIIMPGDLAYIIYTSGSTGKPKGALLHHSGIVNHTYTKIEVLGITDADTVANNFSINVIAAVWQMLAPLFMGARLVVYSDEVEWDPYLQFQVMQADGVSVIELIPPVLKSYLFLLEEGKEKIKLDKLRKIALTSEETKPFVVNKFYENYTGIDLVDCYGQTECCDDILHYTIPMDTKTQKVPIGRPSLNTNVFILNHHYQLQPVGIVGEICAIGAGVCYGYWKRPEMTAEKFIKSFGKSRNPFSKGFLAAGGTLYKTGDLGKWMPDGKIEYLGRIDHQVKIRGNRVELREIENHVLRYPGIKEAAVIAREDREGEKNLYAFFVSGLDITVSGIRQFLLKTLPDYMVPAQFIALEKLPLTPNGKIDRKILVSMPIKDSMAAGATYQPPRNEYETKIQAIWKQLLEKEQIGIDDNFFDLGGHSLLLIKLKSKLEKVFGLKQGISVVELFKYPTIAHQAGFIEKLVIGPIGAEDEKEKNTKIIMPGSENRDIAVIGIALRVPGADGIDEFWQNIINGVESISFFADNELDNSEAYQVIKGSAKLIPAGGVMGDSDLFDADFFGYHPREAELMDPQQRVFLQYAWMALEDAGYVGETYPGSIGVYAGVGWNTYLLNNVLKNPGIIKNQGEFQTMIGNDKDFLATRVSYKLNLKGPSVTIQTACSTSLTAVHLARQALINHDCDMALSGGVAVKIPEKTGYFYTEGGHLSPDGHCRAFDAAAKGTVFGNGAGIVVLKRLTEAAADHDHIYAVIKGSAVNNDGSLKVGFHSPSETGQSEVVAKALRDSGVPADTIGYVETHGTGTALGDPVEISALTRAFGYVKQKQFCALGSVKANIGHLDVAAGVVGFIKAVLCLKHKQIPPSINVSELNPLINFSDSPFYVNLKLRDWPDSETPRRAAASSLGIGGTNVHVILEEFKDASGGQEPSIHDGFIKKVPGPSKIFHYLIPLSAKTEDALKQSANNLVSYFKSNFDKPGEKISLADVTYTLSMGRKAFDWRLALVCEDKEDAISALENFNPKRLLIHNRTPGDKSTVFMFPGVGEHYINMGYELYNQYPVFRREIDSCCEILKPLLEKDLREILFSPGRKKEKSTHEDNSIDLKKLLDSAETFVSEEEQILSQTIYAQTSVFVIEYALAKLLIDWGIKPYAMTGYSIGEYTAACLAGVFSLEDALFLVASRARLINAVEKGAMLAVSLPVQELNTLLTNIHGISIAAVNTPDLCIVSGKMSAIESLEELLKQHKIIFRRLKTFQAFHSNMMETVKKELTRVFEKVTFHPPRIPYISNVSGTWIKPGQAAAADYWVTHTLSPIRFADGIAELLKTSCHFFLEVGPGNSLCGFTAQHPQAKEHKQETRFVFASMPKESEKTGGDAFLLRALGKLWIAGAEINWHSFYKEQYPHEKRKRVPLPTYPFEKKRYWLDDGIGNLKIASADSLASSASISSASAGSGRIPKKENISDWFYMTSWKQSFIPRANTSVMNRLPGENWLLFVDESGPGLKFKQHVQANIKQKSSWPNIIIIKKGKDFAINTGNEGNDGPVYTIKPGKYENYTALLQHLSENGKSIDKIIHWWQWSSAEYPDFLEHGVYSLLYFVKAMAKLSMFNAVELWVVTKGLHCIESVDACDPGKTAILGPCKVIPQEYPHIKCRSIDFEENTARTYDESRIIGNLFTELLTTPPDTIIAYRGVNRWVKSFAPLKVEDSPGVPGILREKGVYLIVGGLGNIGFSIAQYLARAVHARLIITGRTGSLDAAPTTGPRALKIKQLEDAGSEVLYLAMDAADKFQVQQVVKHAEEKWGKIHGVLYAAGTMDENFFKLMADSDRQDCELHFKPKIKGLLALEEALAEKELDFCILTSSLSPLLGGLSLYAYSAANSFMDGFAAKQCLEKGKNWLSINWADWESNINEPISEHCANLVLGSTVVQLNITRDEGRETFKRVLSLAPGPNSFPGIVISSGDLHRRMQQWVNDGESSINDKQTTHKRLPLQSIYEAPRSEAEKTVTGIWQELLGIDMIGVHDNFFELGGHSLIATRLISRLREIFRINIPLPILFNRPTIRDVVDYIINTWGDASTVEEIALAYREFCLIEKNNKGLN
ncbi:MAG: amino acid adenylation domain-containing protein [Acidobacteria bacterium]|nr:amino acid adenylation domain-containing protein [Acidobacteriota bacterium]